MYADLNYYRKTEKRKTFQLAALLKFGALLFLAAYLLVKIVEPVLASGIY
ncbi:hypothetical protein GCM10023091_01750 [Ravibacter arvi]|uniref:Uncharacterized protein n=1 Tax=Ravibacter arvi TaxID=2051041 RepID=A0ABP8LN31_9BACT